MTTLTVGQKLVSQVDQWTKQEATVVKVERNEIFGETEAHIIGTTTFHDGSTRPMHTRLNAEYEGDSIPNGFVPSAGAWKVQN